MKLVSLPSSVDPLASRGIGGAPAMLLAAQLDLSSAWERVAAKMGMAGVDNMSVRRFRICPFLRLKDLAGRLATDRYISLPLRLAELEKKGGSARRCLLVPTVSDRIAQTAVAKWLGGRWNPAFDEASFGYRPGLSVRDALRRVRALREQGFRWTLDADIRSFFDSIPHDRLLACLSPVLGAESPMLGWLRQWISAAVWDGERVYRAKSGVAQGSPLSPLLANFYLHQFDIQLRAAGIKLVRYADDFVICAKDPFDLSEQRVVVERLFAELGLELSIRKTHVRNMEDRFRFLGAQVDGQEILIPLERPGKPYPAVFVASPMPRGLVDAFVSGALAPEPPFVWTPHTRGPQDAETKHVRPEQIAALDRLRTPQ